MPRAAIVSLAQAHSEASKRHLAGPAGSRPGNVRVTVECLVCEQLTELVPGGGIPERCPRCGRLEW